MVQSFGGPSNYGPRTEILPGVWLGDAEDAAIIRSTPATADPKSFGLVAVHEDEASVSLNSHWLPIMTGSELDNSYRASREALDAATSMIRHYQQRGIPVMVHCWAGIERSPLTLAYYLVRYKHFKTITDAYAHIKGLRPQVQERMHWFPKKEMFHGSMP